MRFTIEAILSVLLLPRLLYDIVKSPREVSKLAVAKNLETWDTKYSAFTILLPLSALFFGLSLLKVMPPHDSADFAVEFPKTFGFSGVFGPSTFWAVCMLATLYFIISMLWLVCSWSVFDRDNVFRALRTAILMCFVFLTASILREIFFDARVPGPNPRISVSEFTLEMGFENWRLLSTNWGFWVGKIIQVWSVLIFCGTFIWSVLETRRKNKFQCPS